MKSEKNFTQLCHSHLAYGQRGNYMFGAVLGIPILLAIVWLSPEETQLNTCRAALSDSVSHTRSQNDAKTQ